MTDASTWLLERFEHYRARNVIPDAEQPPIGNASWTRPPLYTEMEIRNAEHHEWSREGLLLSDPDAMSRDPWDSDKPHISARQFAQSR